MPDKRHWSATLAQALAEFAERIEQRQAEVSARDAPHPGSMHTDRPSPVPATVSAIRSGGGQDGVTGGQPCPDPSAPAAAPQVAPRAAVPDPVAVVPWSMRVAAEIGWRMLILAGAVYVLMRVIGAVQLVVLAFVAALLVTALLQPFVARLTRIGVPRSLATVTVCIGGFVVIGLVGWFVVWQVMDNVDSLSSSLQDGISEGKKWLLNSPLHVTDDQINQVADNLSGALSHNTRQLTDAGLQGVTFLVEFLTGMLLAMFSTIFLLYDGHNIWNWVLKLFPAAARDGLAGAGPRAWRTLTLYVRGTVLVALIDATFIGTGIFFLGVPMAVPIAVVIFLCSFVPLVGAVASGAIAVVVALVTQGPFTALMVLAVVLAVQQIEGHVLQPFILGRAVRVHPLAVVLSVSAGTMIAGIGGAVVAVPLVAVGNTAVGYLRAHARQQVLAMEPGLAVAGVSGVGVSAVGASGAAAGPAAAGVGVPRPGPAGERDPAGAKPEAGANDSAGARESAAVADPAAAASGAVPKGGAAAKDPSAAKARTGTGDPAAASGEDSRPVTSRTDPAPDPAGS